jgi:hypothetical protein
MLTINTIKPEVSPPSTSGAASAAYARHARRCAALLRGLDSALWGHALDAAAEPGNRGYVVELAVLEHRLAEAMASLSGQDDASVQRMLADLDASG